MFLDDCPMLDELRQFLDEQFVCPGALLGTHVDTCLSCQAAIETLLQVEASHLFKSSLAELTQSGGCGVRAQVVIDQTGGVTDALDDLPRRDLETEAASRIDGQSAIDQGVGSRPMSMRAGRKTHCRIH